MRPSFAKACRGVSLVELMIAMTLGMMLVAVIGYAFMGARQTFRTMDTLSRMQENARFVFEGIAYDLRMAGSTGCSSATQANVLNNPGDWDKNLFGQPLIGYEESGGATPPGCPAACCVAMPSPCCAPPVRNISSPVTIPTPRNCS
ncbi:PilW family protein [Methylogaea oryzae]|uniref:PilW family protein n=1 Tax=Methylogaea oryzae TaxID=1295382 RepID=UPI0009EC5363|nr:prepilin-type N-terminal cleavage/methylation domain-containing protein [Methylogaea oryzae]